MMEMTVLGCQGPYPAPEGATSGYFVTGANARLQLDLGSGTLAALTALTAPEELTALILTHWHYDHCCDVLPLLYRLESACAQGAEPLAVYAPADETSPVRQAVMNSAAVQLHSIAPGDELVLGGVTVRVFSARHPVPAVMLRLEADGRALCYTGDTNETPGLPDFARDASLLLADGLFPASVWSAGKPHLSAEKAAGLAADAGAERLLVTHMNPAFDPEGLLREARARFPGAELAVRGRRYGV